MKTLITFFCLAYLSLSAYAQEDKPVQSEPDSSTYLTPTQKEGLFRRIATDGSNTFTTIVRAYAQPVHWQKSDYLRLGSVLAVSAASLAIEKQLNEFTKRNQTKTLDRFERAGFYLGRPQLNYPIMLSLWGTGVLFNNDWLRDTGIMVIASVTTSGLIQTASKEIVGRSRPSAQVGNLHFRPFGGPAYHSFPSGHATLATATFWILAHQVKPVPIKVFFYALPIVTGLSRIYSGAHWLSDVLLGTAMGVAFAESVVRIYPLVKANRKLSMDVTCQPTGPGLTIRF